MQRFFLHKVFQGKLSNMSDTCLVDGDILISTAALDPEIGLSEFLISEDGSHETMRKILNYSQEILPLEGTKAGGMLSPYVYRVELE